MIAYGLFVTLAFSVVVWCVGETAARLLFGRRSSLVTAAARLPLGLSTTVCVLEGTGYFLPIRIALWFVLALGTYGALSIARAWGRGSWSRNGAIVTASLGAILVGLVPVLVAGRFTAAALTNNDGTYYITVADWLARVPWRFEYPSWETVPESHCLLESVLHVWRWRTGTPNLMAAVSSLSGLGSPAALAVTTALLFACVPCTAIGMARALGVPRGSARELLVGVIPTCGAAPAFLGYQHMTGHLAIQSLFPFACFALVAAVRHGGWQRVLYAALPLGASVALFADGAPALVLIAAAALVASGRRVTRSLRRLLAVAISAIAVTPFTFVRAAWAAWNTVAYRVPRAGAVFPQRGWLPRGVLDDLATLTSVDPWPPWPAVWPPSAQTVITWAGACLGAGLLVCGAIRLRANRGERRAALFLASAVLLGVVLTRVRYLKGKVLLTGAALAAPLCGLGAAELCRRRRGRVVPAAFIFSELFAVSGLARPSHWNVVDKPEHDALIPELARLPRGSILALDGLGAPSDPVLDTHRAERAARLAGLRVLRPGLDGGFYTPYCRDIERPAVLPPRAYALQRTTSETLTRGETLAAWGSFRLLSVDLETEREFVAAWAPTHGWLRAEREPDGRVFRWAESEALGTLHGILVAPCARLRGEARVVRGSGLVGIRVSDEPVYTGGVSPDWSSFETLPFSTAGEVVLHFVVTQAEGDAADPARALAVSRLELEPVSQCGRRSP
jgi:hypothetical protein